MTSQQIRKAFLDFFTSKGHLIVPSSPLVAKNDPTLLFNNSGMAQFKDFFLGNGIPPSKRIADTQKCLRVSGKHNDLEEVGFDTYHHTMFEMLGNWSFGDYFKKEALQWSWELLTEVYKLPKDRIYVSVFEGSEAESVPFDQEAFDLWKEILGSDERIILGNKKDNFWEMGDVGPCGPSSEIHIDLRSQTEVDQVSGKELVNQDHPQVVEIWNNVFIQYERKADSSLIPLPAKHVDTGMGFERLCMAIQGKQSNYDTDIFQNTIQVLEKMSGKKYGENGTLTTDNYVDVAMRVVADHLRAVAFSIADGQLPSNVKAGYVIRRILRRAVRYGYSYLGFKEPFIYQLAPVLADQFADVFPELKNQSDFVTKVIEEEEKTFLKTLEQGIKRLDTLFQQENPMKIIDGNTAFELSDTFGFPLDLTALIAREKGFSVDDAGFNAALAEQKNRSRQDASKEASDWVELSKSEKVEFVGYDFLETPAQIIRYRKVKNKKGAEMHLVLDKTPFYAESGGQVGDTGILTLEKNGKTQQIRIEDTKKENDLFIHISNDKGLDSLLEGFDQPVEIYAKVDNDRRANITKNHSVTHLMLAALRKVLGRHIVQRGSYQNDTLTRFDFSHFAKVNDEELKLVEDLVNEKIEENVAVKIQHNVPIKEALTQGATATFGEKYGEFVRIVTMDPNYSVELCGGTHVKATGDIGLFKFISEGSVSAGVRRIEALTGKNALAYIREQEQILNQLKEKLKGAADLPKAIDQLIEEKGVLQKKIEKLERDKIQTVKKELASKIMEKDGLSYIAEVVEVPNSEALKSLSFDLKNIQPNIMIVLGAIVEAKPHLVIYVSEAAQAEKQLHAGNLIKEASKSIRGGGGGQAHFATAGGSFSEGIQEAVQLPLTKI